MNGYLAAKAPCRILMPSTLSFDANFITPSFRAPSSNVFCLSADGSLFTSAKICSAGIAKEDSVVENRNKQASATGKDVPPRMSLLL
jgi:hypothetical protein